MASAFTHAFAAIAIGKTATDKKLPLSLWVAGAFCAVVPDADAIGYFTGVPYDSVWGHRGISHSILFSVLLGALLAIWLSRKEGLKGHFWWLFAYLAICGISHGVLDAMTTGGKGVAFFAPFYDERFFFPFRFIKVSPMGVGRFFSEWGLRVIASELLWVWLPGIVVVIVAQQIRRRTKLSKG